MSDPLGRAILEYPDPQNPVIVVESDKMDEDEIPVDYLFRSYKEMPRLEQIALDHCHGFVADLGAGAGPHSKYLIEKGVDVLAIDNSPGAAAYLKKEGVEVEENEILQIKNREFDTILLLMNGLGLAGTMDRLDGFLNHLKELLTEDGIILLESTDISYLYIDNDGSIVIDLNDLHPEQFQFRMRYKNETSEWFSWIYVDFDKLSDHANRVGLNSELLFESETNSYLAKLSKKK